MSHVNFINSGDRKIVSKDGKSLLNLAYDDALKILKFNGDFVTLIVLQMFRRKQLKEAEPIKVDSSVKEPPKSNLKSMPSKNLPNIMHSRDHQRPNVRKSKIESTFADDNFHSRLSR